MIRIRCLGPVEVEIDGAAPPAELLWRKHLALLVYLARSPRGTRTRSHLIGLLWSDRSEAAARHSLNEALRILRKAAGADAIEASHEQVRLLEGAVALDVEALDRLGDGAAPAAALALIRGDFLEGFDVPGCQDLEEWLAAERRLWREQCVGVLARLGTLAAQRADPAGALRLGALACRLDPVSELGARAMMEILTLAGDGPAAVAHYDAYRAALTERLGASSSADLAALAERLRRHGAARRARARAADPEALARRAALIGRAEELRGLREEWSAARADRAGAVILLGDLGTGKTRLVDEMVGAAVIDGATAVVFRAVEGDADRPHAAVLGLAQGGLLDAPGVSGANAGALAGLSRHLADWADRFRPPPQADPAALGPAFVEVVSAALQQGPLLLVVDDAQWCDADSLAVLLQALRDCRARPLLILVAAAPQPARAELDALRVRLGAGVPGRAIHLAPLSRPAVRELAGALLPGWNEDALDRVSRRVAADSGGYPLLAVELLRAVAAGLELGTGAPAWPRPDATLSQTFPGDLPDTVVASIRVSFRRLTPDAQTVLSAAAALGERVDPGRLEAAAALPGERFDGALGELEWSRWLVAGHRDYTFAARLLRDVVALDFVTGAQRRRFRLRAGADG